MKKIVILLFSLIFLTGCSNGCVKEKLQSADSPNGEKVINTYLINCHATVDWSVTAEICDKNGQCEEIYDCYHENGSLVYWIDDEQVFINNKILNIYQDKYDWRNDDDYYDKVYKVK